MIRVLVVDDSAVVRTLIRDVLERDPEIRVVAEADNGATAVELAQAARPDLITMDVTMPVLDGLDATAEIMARQPTPILVFSASLDRAETDLSFQAVQRGALDVMLKPAVDSAADFAAIGQLLIDRVKLLSRIHVIPHPRGRQRKTRSIAKDRLPTRPRVLLIGASLGGPNTVLQLLQGLPPNFPAPILLVQHIASGFTEGLARWLARETQFTVRVAVQGDTPTPGTVLVAPAGRHLALRGGLAVLHDAPPLQGCRPAVDELFASAARDRGADCIAVLLTGMGQDGADGSAAVKRARGTTIAQDQATSVVWGMPRAAIERGVIDKVLPIGRIAPELVSLVAPA
jgi:two-component system chemotaxis response regulator CheB